MRSRIAKRLSSGAAVGHRGEIVATQRARDLRCRYRDSRARIALNSDDHAHDAAVYVNHRPAGHARLEADADGEHASPIGSERARVDVADNGAGQALPYSPAGMAGGSNIGTAGKDVRRDLSPLHARERGHGDNGDVTSRPIDADDRARLSTKPLDIYRDRCCAIDHMAGGDHDAALQDEARPCLQATTRLRRDPNRGNDIGNGRQHDRVGHRTHVERAGVDATQSLCSTEEGHDRSERGESQLPEGRRAVRHGAICISSLSFL